MPIVPKRRRLIRFIGRIACCVATVPAGAGQVTLRDGPGQVTLRDGPGQSTLRDGALPMIGIEGHLTPGDERSFHDLAVTLPNALVVLTGPGGSLAVAIAIGQELRSRGWQTLVPAEAFCASACAVIWLAGTQRLLGTNAHIGFHAIAAAHGGGAAVETHAFDSFLVEYLTGLGYAFDVTATIVNTPSVLVRWLDLLELNANGIATQSYP